MTTTKALILTAVILSVAVFAFIGIRQVKKNNKKSFGERQSTNKKEIEDNGSTSSPTEKKYSFKEIIQSITNQPAKA